MGFKHLVTYNIISEQRNRSIKKCACPQSSIVKVTPT